ncbi:MAG: GNAT family N-acetyltransferase [Pseudonocardiaceae bacterium]
MVEIRSAEPRDVQALADLMEDIDRFYGATDVESSSQRAPQIAASLFQEPRAAYVLLAWEGEQLVGMAAYSFLWPAAGVTRSLYLKELYVIESFRRKGVGKLLILALCQVAVKHECSRIEWTADTGNVLAKAFYEQLGVPQNREKTFYRLEGNDVRWMLVD